MSGIADGSEVYVSMPPLDCGDAPSVPSGPRYQVRASVPGTGNVENVSSNPEYGLPGVVSPVGDAPAPLSKRTRTSGSALNAASAAS